MIYEVKEMQVTIIEKVKFAEYTGALSAFASGYLISKLDSAVARILSPEVLFTPLVGFRVISSASSAIMAAVITYVGRRYLHI